MEFNEKLQELRKQKGITQEELASRLYVSRTAVSKWESGRGYPSIDSLKAIARFFSVTVDELLSSNEILMVAEEDQKQSATHFRDLVFGLLDLCMSMLLFLPLFAEKTGDLIRATSLLSLGNTQLYLMIAYYFAVVGSVVVGVLTLALQNSASDLWLKGKTGISMILGVISSLLFMVSLQPYAAVFVFAMLVIKAIVLIKRR